MIKRIFATLLTLLMLACTFGVVAHAEYRLDGYDNEYAYTQTLPALIDEADILTEFEFKELDEKLRSLSKEYGITFVAVTIDEYNYTPLNDIADMLYADCGYINTESGSTVFCIYQHGGEGEREIVIVRYGDEAKDKFSDSDCSGIIGKIKSDFANGNYATGFDGFITQAEKVLNPSVSWIWIILCPLIGFGVTFIVSKIIASANKSVRRKVNAADYVDSNALAITNAADIYLYSQVTATPKATNNNTSSSTTRAGGRSTSSGKF